MINNKNLPTEGVAMGLDDDIAAARAKSKQDEAHRQAELKAWSDVSGNPRDDVVVGPPISAEWAALVQEMLPRINWTRRHSTPFRNGFQRGVTHETVHIKFSDGWKGRAQCSSYRIYSAPDGTIRLSKKTTKRVERFFLEDKQVPFPGTEDVFSIFKNGSDDTYAVFLMTQAGLTYHHRWYSSPGQPISQPTISIQETRDAFIAYAAKYP